MTQGLESLVGNATGARCEFKLTLTMTPECRGNPPVVAPSKRLTFLRTRR